MKTKINKETWNRKEHFDFFIKFDEPFFGLTTDVDCTLAYQKAKAGGFSFYFYYLYQSLLAVNQIENFRYRIINNEIWMFDTIHASATSLRADHTFGFTFIPFSESFQEFVKHAQHEKKEIEQSEGLRLSENTNRLDVIHYTTIPWTNFTSISHARSFQGNDSMPKISFGKLYENNGQKNLPVSIHAHHALMDGKHVGDYLHQFQHLLNH